MSTNQTDALRQHLHDDLTDAITALTATPPNVPDALNHLRGLSATLNITATDQPSPTDQALATLNARNIQFIGEIFNHPEGLNSITQLLATKTFELCSSHPVTKQLAAFTLAGILTALQPHAAKLDPADDDPLTALSQLQF